MKNLGYEYVYEKIEKGDGRDTGRTTYVRKYGPDGEAVKGPDGKAEYEEWAGPELEYKPDADTVGCFPKEVRCRALNSVHKSTSDRTSTKPIR